MAYVPYTWENLPNVTTPISKANLDHLETQYTEMINLFGAHSLLMAIADNDPAALTIAASRIVGRKAAGNIVALTGAEVLTIAGWTANKLLKGAGAGVAPTEIDVPNIKYKAETRAMNAASGNVAYTGYGFTPTALIIFAKEDGVSEGSIGGCDAAGEAVSVWGVPAANISELVVQVSDGAGNIQLAAWNAYGADGFTLTWTKIGNPVNTCKMTVFAFG